MLRNRLTILTKIYSEVPRSSPYPKVGKVSVSLCLSNDSVMLDGTLSIYLFSKNISISSRIISFSVLLSITTHWLNRNKIRATINAVITNPGVFTLIHDTPPLLAYYPTSLLGC